MDHEFAIKYHYYYIIIAYDKFERDCSLTYVTVSVYLGTTINKQQIMPQKTNHIRTAFILFPGPLKQPYGFLVRCPDK